MKKFKKYIVLFLAVFLLSCSVSVRIVTKPYSLENYDGSIVRATAAGELGNEGGDKYWSWCGFDDRVEWCACFVSWCFSRCWDGFPKISACGDFVSWLKEMRGWYSSDIEPVTGMIVFFDFDKDRRADHMGIADRCEDEKIYVIEGNSGNKCEMNVYDADDSAILGYGAVLQA